MPNSYPELQNFQFTPNNRYGFFLLQVLPLTMHLSLNQFYSKILTFLVKKMFGSC